MQDVLRFDTVYCIDASYILVQYVPVCTYEPEIPVIELG